MECAGTRPDVLRRARRSVLQTLREANALRALTLLALVLHFALAAGHHHSEEPSASAPAFATASSLHGLSVPTVALLAPDAPSSSKPPARTNGDPAECSICWSIAIAGSAVVASHEFSIGPGSITDAAFVSMPEAIAIYRAISAFEARGPPALRIV